MKKNAGLPALLLLAGTAQADIGSCKFDQAISVRIMTCETHAALMESYRELVSSRATPGECRVKD